MEVYSWIVVEKSMPPEVKEAQRLFTQRTFSPSGLLEQDDGENWGEIQKVLKGTVQKRYAFNYQMGLGHEREDVEGYPGRLSYVMSEGAARGFYRRYAQLMDADVFPSELPERPETSATELTPMPEPAAPQAATMQQRSLGTSGLSVSVVGLGGNTFGPPRIDEETTVRVIHAALDLGINFVDTAIVYGQGESERYIATALKDRRDEMVLATKFHFMGLGAEKPADRIRSQVDESLQKLGTDRIDLYQLHMPAPEVPASDILGTLSELVAEGKVLAIGCSNYTSWRLVESWTRPSVSACCHSPPFRTTTAC